MKKRTTLIALFLCAVMLFALTGCKSADYKKATKLLEAGDARAAYDMFTALVDYKDSPARR